MVQSTATRNGSSQTNSIPNHLTTLTKYLFTNNRNTLTQSHRLKGYRIESLLTAKCVKNRCKNDNIMMMLNEMLHHDDVAIAFTVSS